MARRLLVWTPAILVMGTIAWLSHRPDWPTAAHGHPDWLLHGVAFGVLAAGYALGLTDAGRLPLSVPRALGTVMAASLYGGLDEWHQSMVPGRQATWEDWAADTVGATLCAMALYVAGRMRRDER